MTKSKSREPQIGDRVHRLKTAGEIGYHPEYPMTKDIPNDHPFMMAGEIRRLQYDEDEPVELAGYYVDWPGIDDETWESVFDVEWNPKFNRFELDIHKYEHQ